MKTQYLSRKMKNCGEERKRNMPAHHRYKIAFNDVNIEESISEKEMVRFKADEENQRNESREI